MSEKTENKIEDKDVTVKKSSKFFIIFLIIFLFLLAALPAVYFYIQYKNVQSQIATPATATKEQIQELIKKVGKIMRLPTDEQPTVATISNIDQLKKQQSFFVNAKNGDKVLMYTKNKRIIIYDPIENLIVDEGPLTIAATNSAQLTQAPSNPNTTLTPTPSGKPTPSTTPIPTIKK